MDFLSSLPSDEQGRYYKRHNAHKLYKYVHRGPGCVLERVAYGVAHDGGLMRLGTLAAEVALLDELLGVVPRATGVGHEYRQQHSGYRRAREHPAERVRPEYEANGYRRGHREHAGGYHLSKRRLCAYVYAAGHVGLGALPAFEQAGDLPELPPYLVDHLVSRLADARHCKRAYEERQYPAHEEPYDDVGVGQHYLEGPSQLGAYRLPVRREERERRQGRRGYGEALAYRGRGVAERVEAVGDGPYVFAELAHLGDAAGVIRYRAVCVDAHYYTGSGEHPYRGYADPVDAREVVGYVVSRPRTSPRSRAKKELKR